MDVHIGHIDVSVDTVDSDEVRFATLFAALMRAVQAQREEDESRRRLAESDRHIGCSIREMGRGDRGWGD